MRKQHREPGTELAPLEYVLAKKQAEREAGQQTQLAASMEPVSGQEAQYDRV